MKTVDITSSEVIEQIRGSIPVATIEKNGLMSKNMAVINSLQDQTWHEISGNGAFMLIHGHPLLNFSSIYIGIINNWSSGSIATVTEILKGSLDSTVVKIKAQGSKEPKVYYYPTKASWVKVIPIYGDIYVKLTEDTVEE